MSLVSLFSYKPKMKQTEVKQEEEEEGAEEVESSMAKHLSRSLMSTSSSLLMASLFAYSAAVQLDHADWYVWFLLYASACGVNLLQMWSSAKPVAWLSLVLGAALFLKVVVEDCVGGMAGFWSLDMRERVVREKLGSGLVLASMFLHLKGSGAAADTKKGRGRGTPTWVDYGMVGLVAVSYGLSFYFFMYVIGDMKED